MSTPKIKAALEKYAEIRDKRSAIKKAYEEKDAILKDGLDKIEVFLMRYLDAQDLQSVNAGLFTGYIAKEHKVGCADWASFWEWMAVNKRCDMTEKRVAVGAVKEYLEAKGELPPFVNHSVERVVRVRRT